MKDKKEQLMMWNLMFVTSLIVANVISSKLVIIGGHFIVPSAVVSYAFTFLCTDIIGEVWGKEEANKTVKRGLIFQVIATIFILLAIQLPVAPFMTGFQEQFKSVLGGSFRMTLASLGAYIVAQANDVYVFHKIKEKTGKKHRWLRNNASTICSQFIDTSIFITIAFYGKVPNLWVLIYSQFIVKVILALLDTPIFYYFTNKKIKSENEK